MQRVAVVTGANQGIGLAVVRRLAITWDRDDVIYLTGRHKARVEDAAGEIGGGSRVVTEVLDVTDDKMASDVAARLRARHSGVDVVISNAAARLTPDPPQADQVRTFVETNNLGTTRMIRAFGPLVRSGGRFIVVASAFGSLRNLPEHLHERFDTDRMTLSQVDDVMKAYAIAVEQGRARDDGWPEWINIPSKVGQVAAIRVFARQQSTTDPRAIFIAAACPGLVDTGASRPWFADMTDAQTPDQAAAHLVALAADPPVSSHHGELIQFGRIIRWA